MTSLRCGRTPALPGGSRTLPSHFCIPSRRTHVNRMRRGHKLLVLAAASTLVIAACGSDDGDDTGDTGDTTEETTAGTSGETEDTTADTTPKTPKPPPTPPRPRPTSRRRRGAGGEFIDLGTFVGDPPEHIDPALNSTLDAYQVINAVYDGLTDIDSADPANPVDRAARRRELRVERGRHRVDVRDPRRRTVRRRRRDQRQHLPELLGARCRSRR